MSVPLRTPASYPHVEHDGKGDPVLSGTTMKIVELVMAQKAHGWSPEEIHFQHPELSLGQIYSALAYYWDHQEELDADIERRSQYAEAARREADLEESPMSSRIGHLRGRLDLTPRMRRAQ
jgi:uncharacterized protein (DUF433 family)